MDSARRKALNLYRMSGTCRSRTIDHFVALKYFETWQEPWTYSYCQPCLLPERVSIDKTKDGPKSSVCDTDLLHALPVDAA